MREFYFRKKNGIYFSTVICSVIMVAICLFFGIFFCFDMPKNIFFILWNIFYFIGIIILVITLFKYIALYKKSYKIQDKKLEFYGKADFDSVVRYDKIFKNTKRQLQTVSIPDISYCFITEFKYRIGISSLYIEKEKLNDQKCVAGYMFLLSQFVFDKERCSDSETFNRFNERKDYKSQFYETMCSMLYQEQALNALYENGFCGEIFISSTIYQPRKQSFDGIFSKHSVPKDKIHIF